MTNLPGVVWTPSYQTFFRRPAMQLAARMFPSTGMSLPLLPTPAIRFAVSIDVTAIWRCDCGFPCLLQPTPTTHLQEVFRASTPPTVSSKSLASNDAKLLYQVLMVRNKVKLRSKGRIICNDFNLLCQVLAVCGDVENAVGLESFDMTLKTPLVPDLFVTTLRNTSV